MKKIYVTSAIVFIIGIIFLGIYFSQKKLLKKVYVPQKIIYKVGEKVPYEEDGTENQTSKGYAIKVDKVYGAVDEKEMLKIVGIKADEDTGNNRYFLIKTTAYNDGKTSSEKSGIAGIFTPLVSDNLAGYVDSYYFAELNNLPSSYGFSLKPKTNRTIYFPISLQANIDENDIKGKKLFLKITNLPNRKLIQLN